MKQSEQIRFIARDMTNALTPTDRLDLEDLAEKLDATGN